MITTRILWRAVLVAIPVLAMVADARAQTRSQITGTISDSSQAVLPGATVVLSSPDLVGGAQTSVTSDRGLYRFVDLPPGTYSLRASLTGFQGANRTGIRLLFGATTTIDLTLAVGNAAESVTVDGVSPTVDVTTAQATSQVGTDLIQNTPTLTDPRNGNELISMIPGINFRSAFGGSRSANQLLLDGSPTTLPETQGTNAAVVNSNWLQEIQVVSLGASAEHGEFSGTVANFVLKSGSGTHAGMVEYRTVRPSWLDDNTSSLPANLQSRFNSTKVLTQWDTTAQLGGPLVKERLFYFAGYQYIRADTQAAGVPAPNSQKQWRALAKLTFAASKAWKLDGTFQANSVVLKGGATTTSTADVGTVNTEPNRVFSLRATWTPNPKTLVEIRSGGLDYEQTIDPKNGGRTGPSPRRDTITGISSVNAANYSFLDQGRLSLGGSVTRYADNVLGRHHELKLGLDVQSVRYYKESGFPSGMSFTDRAGVPDQVVIWAGDTVEASGRQMTFYAQDGWNVNGRLTLEPGVRVTVNRGKTPTSGDVYSTTPVSPRFGAALDLGSGHHTVLRGHVGRYHEAFSTIEYEFTDTAHQTVQVTARVLGPNNFQELSRFTPATNQLVAPDIQQAYLDQYLLGVEHELFRDFSVKAQYIHREYKKLFNWIDAKSVYAPTQVRDPGPDNVANTADDGATFTAYNLTNPGVGNRVFSNPPDASRRYRAFQIVVEKRFARNWQVLAGYTRSKAEGSVNNNQGDNYGGATVANNPFINPNNAINATGRNTLDFTDEVIVRGSYHFDFFGGWNAGGVYRYITGQALSRTAVFRLTQGNTTIRVEPRGALPTAATNAADVRLDKTFSLGRTRRMSVYLDIFNVTNQGIATGLTEASGATYGVPSGWSTPRTFQLAGRLSF